MYALVSALDSVFVGALVNALVSDPNPAVRELCAVLARRELPKMLGRQDARGVPNFPLDVCDAVKTGLLQALGSDCSPSMRRKMCDTVGRVGAEYHSSGGYADRGSNSRPS